MIVLNRKYISMLGLAFKAVTSRSLCVCSNNTATLSSYFITNCLEEIMLMITARSLCEG